MRTALAALLSSITIDILPPFDRKKMVDKPDVLFQGSVYDELPDKSTYNPLFADKLAKFADEVLLCG